MSRVQSAGAQLSRVQTPNWDIVREEDHRRQLHIARFGARKHGSRIWSPRIMVERNEALCWPTAYSPPDDAALRALGCSLKTSVG